MKTLRHNIYNKVHSGLRTLMLDAGLKIQRTDFSRPKEADRTIALIREVIGGFEYHARHEDDRIFHAVADKAPYIVAMFEKATAKNLQMAINIGEMVDQFETIKNRSQKVKHGSYLQNVFFEFTAAVLQTMNKEETVVNELLWAHYTDKEIQALERQLIIEPKSEYIDADEKVVSKSGEFARWMGGILDNATPFLQGKLSEMTRNIISPHIRVA